MLFIRFCFPQGLYAYMPIWCNLYVLFWSSDTVWKWIIWAPGMSVRAIALPTADFDFRHLKCEAVIRESKLDDNDTRVVLLIPLPSHPCHLVHHQYHSLLLLRHQCQHPKPDPQLTPLLPQTTTSGSFFLYIFSSCGHANITITIWTLPCIKQLAVSVSCLWHTKIPLWLHRG
jgi:hypothetical protein